MAKFSSLFSQILEFFPPAEFDRKVRQFEAEKGAKGFSCRQQLVAMLFCQLGRAHSLREITDGLATCEGKLRHLGIIAPGRSTLAYANAHRPWKLYEALFYDVLGKCQAVAQTKRRSFKFKNKLYSLDSTVIDLCLSAFDWAKFRRTKGAIKLHLRLDHDGYLPEFGLVTEGAVHDVNALERFRFQRGSIYVFDRGYTDYGWFGKFCQEGVFFVTRLKDNAAFEVVEHGGPSHGGAVVKDDHITFTGYKAGGDCPFELRRVRYYDFEQKRFFEFLTNLWHLSPQTIADIYKARWAIEAFFKALKQNLKIKTFVGTTPNAVKIQIWTALVAILLLKYMKLRASFGWSLSNLAALLRMNLFTYRDLWAWLDKPFETPPEILPVEQMEMKLA